ncbi:hypothetical protein EVAR_44083_1 [Eumeta japonica]|uniref:Uncharacterized protein n=1 Tax=Eumeta variegata TaxID=151549 RepID=A0A4C1X0H5_EUMVA|nr:hypothetical protein EVAR_44083_1 [Eumeta japonica]
MTVGKITENSRESAARRKIRYIFAAHPKEFPPGAPRRSAAVHGALSRLEANFDFNAVHNTYAVKNLIHRNFNDDKIKCINMLIEVTLRFADGIHTLHSSEHVKLSVSDVVIVLTTLVSAFRLGLLKVLALKLEMERLWEGVPQR